VCGHADTTGFSRVVLSFNLDSKTARRLDTTGFSRVVFQLQPKEQNRETLSTIDFAWRFNFYLTLHHPNKAETETPRD
jgi:hypothetical protein